VYCHQELAISLKVQPDLEMDSNNTGTYIGDTDEKYDLRMNSSVYNPNLNLNW
jgi:hypothetical protein